MFETQMLGLGPEDVRCGEISVLIKAKRTSLFSGKDKHSGMFRTMS